VSLLNSFTLPTVIAILCAMKEERDNKANRENKENSNAPHDLPNESILDDEDSDE